MNLQQRMDKYIREPCPWCIFNDGGGAFVLGSIGDGIFQGITGFRNSPSGIKKRMIGGLQSIKMNTPWIAGSFALWGTTFSAVECTLVKIRGKEDPWNFIISGAATGGIMVARHGLTAMVRNTIFCGMLGFLLTEINSRFYEPLSPTERDPETLHEGDRH